MFLDFNPQDVATYKRMIENSRQTVIGADHSKILGKANYCMVESGTDG